MGSGSSANAHNESDRGDWIIRGQAYETKKEG
jgi:hypothetical protein